ncbi:MAG: hypothetical protein AAFN93_29635 [Bacteroidota bacterium]
MIELIIELILSQIPFPAENYEGGGEIRVNDFLKSVNGLLKESNFSNIKS